MTAKKIAGLSFALITLSFILNACRSMGVNKEARAPAYYYEPSTDGEPRYKDLLEAANSGARPTLESAIENLNAKFPYFFREPVMIYRSRSLQPATFNQPRVLLGGASAEMIVAYNDQGMRNGHSFETMTFNRKKGFEFRQIAFVNNGGSKAIAKEDLDLNLSTEQVLVSKPNLMECMDCHGYGNTRPIWDTYFIWPGIYGSQDDESIGRASNDQDRTFVMKKSGVERKKLLAFLKATENHPRYKYLAPALREEPNSDNTELSSNDNMTENLYRYTVQDIVRELFQEKTFWPYRYALAGILTCGPRQNGAYVYLTPAQVDSAVRRFLPPTIYAHHESKAGKLAAVIAANSIDVMDYELNKARLEQEYLGQKLKLVSESGKMPPAYKAAVAKEMKYLRSLKKLSNYESEYMKSTLFDFYPAVLKFLVEPIGISTQDWGPNKARVLTFHNGGDDTKLFPLAIAEEVLQYEDLPVWHQLTSELAKIHNDYHASLDPQLCENLEQASVKAFGL